MVGSEAQLSVPLRAMMMSVIIVGASIACFVRAEPAPKSPATAAATQPEDEVRDEAFLRAMRDARTGIHNTIQALQEAGSVKKMDEVLELSLDPTGQLSVQFSTTGPAAEAQRSGRVNLEGSESILQMQPVGRRIAAGGGGPIQIRRMTRYDFDMQSDDDIWSTTLNATTQSIKLVGQSITGRTMLNQSNGRITFIVMRKTTAAEPFRMVQTLQAGSLRDLRGQNPVEFQTLIAPLLRKVSDLRFLRLGAGDVYSVFEEIPADESIVQRVMSILPRLDAEDPIERENASADLSKLGQPGVLASLRVNDSMSEELSFEQHTRLAKFVADNRALGALDADAARLDRMFLADCLDFEDLAVRDAAKVALEELLGHPIEFNTQFSAESPLPALNALRNSLGVWPPQTQPAATQPANVDQ